MKIKQLFDLKNIYDIFLFDIWGVILEDESRCYPDVVENINILSKEKKVFYLSNSPMYNLHPYHKLKNFGLNLNLENVVTSGLVFQKIISERPKDIGVTDFPVIYNIGGRNDILENVNCKITYEIAQANLLIFSASFFGEISKELMNEIEIASYYNIPAICSNPDTQITLSDGSIKKCPGYCANIYEKLGGKVKYIGKPNKEVYEYLFKHGNIDINKEKTIMIGDTIATDIKGAKNVGIDSAIVITGNTQSLSNSNDITHIKNSIEKESSFFGAFPDYILNLSNK